MRYSATQTVLFFVFFNLLYLRLGGNVNFEFNLFEFKI